MGRGHLSDLLRLGLHDLHVSLGGKMVPFAGYDMPVQYPAGVMKEHIHTRTAAGLFDVSHMGQVILHPKGSMADLALVFEALMPVDVLGLAQGRQRYGLFTNDAGGILDDLMFANRGDHLFVVVNAACKHADVAHMRAHLSAVAEVEFIENRALLALQGPQAGDVLARLIPETAAMRFMDVARPLWQGTELWVSRSGYTGEDGFEISVPEARAEAFAKALLAEPEVLPIGLGARDSLRLEAGLCLYGHDIDTTTSPVEAGLTWAIQKARRAGGDRAGGFPGAPRILSELATGPARLRVGLRPDGRAPMREGTAIFSDKDESIGTITSGGFGPSVEAPVAMGYVSAPNAATGTTLLGELRGKRLPVTVTDLPFHPTSYKR
ncbi:glycine cleavage system aminomethyltransferase GcvT [Paragemmobacter straminiformis]|uniref:aminomethyltransferase n=1 Tax=Paragemmobacter straminiformis TaxID=2045119 RepID=A0A842I347_9RHOB|nr:glycine cleavage system aminomethyltransferase GcvT [Gemmobacter straminiformis]MBC2834156.1 glycine cleavage system aminomethyltransferase GcvT [Gemmobacter straminiformis]